jgi:hypothetical protein
MSACERAIEVEDMLLGLDASDDLSAHVASCADCQDAREMFRAERALFAARPAVAPPALEKRRARPVALDALTGRVVPALAGLAAAVALLASGQPFSLRASALRSADCESAPSVGSPSIDEPLTCEARAFSAPAPAMTLASHGADAPRCVAVASDRATCESPSASELSSLSVP